MAEQPKMSETESRARLALLWMQAQPVVSAYIASSVRDRQNCEDLLQETVLALAESFDHYDAGKPFVPWAIGVAKNKLLNYYRQHGRDRHVFDAELLAQIGTRFDDRSDDLKARHSALQHCMERMAQASRAILEMRYVRGMGYEEIAEKVGRSTAGVANNLYRSRKALADCVQRQSSMQDGGEA